MFARDSFTALRAVEKGDENPQVWPYRSFFPNFTRTGFPLDVSNSTISEVYHFSEPDAALQHWHEALVNVYDKHAPFKTIRVKHTAKLQWLTRPVQGANHYR